MSPVGVANAAIDWQQVKNQFVSGIVSQLAYAQAQSHYPGTRSQLEDPTNPGTGCELDGKSVSCGKLLRQARNGGIDEDSVKFYGDSPLNGPGYGGGRTLHDDGEGNIEQVSNVIEGDLNGELIVDRQGGPREPTQKQTVITCTVGLWARPLDDAKGLFEHMFVTTKQSNQKDSIVWHAFNGIGVRAGILTGRTNKFDDTDEDFLKFETPPHGKPTFSASITIEGECKPIRASFDTSRDAINGKNHKYPTNSEHIFNSTYKLPNSNAFAFTLLGQWSVENRNALLKGLKMDINRAPGWGTNLLK